MTALLAGSGFQNNSTKIGVVDSNAVIQAVAISKNLVEQEKNLRTDRETVVQFLQRYPVMKKEDAEKFKDLTLKATKTDADKSELQRLTTAAQDAQKKFKDLELKSSPTADELKALDDYRNRQNEMGEYLNNLVKDMQKDLADQHDKNQDVVYKAFKAGLEDVGKRQGFTVVLDKNLAPYGANDITNDTTTVATKK